MIKVELIYKGLCSLHLYRVEQNLVNGNALDNLRYAFEVNFPRVSQYSNNVDIFRFCNGTTKPEENVFKWKAFTVEKITEIAQLVAIEVVD